METVPQPERKFTRAELDKATEQYHWSLTGPAGVVELIALDVLPLGRVIADRFAAHARFPFDDADEHGKCPVLGSDGHCTNYNLLGDRLIRAWNQTRDDEPIWSGLASLYQTLAVAQ